MNRHTFDLVSFIFGSIFVVLAAAAGFAASLTWIVPALRLDLIGPIVLVLIGGWVVVRTTRRTQPVEVTEGEETTE